jgi:glycosyltransferase involved in cell wall biosynthesis
MRIAYACRDLASDSATGPGARTFAAAVASAGLGHDVCLVSAELASPWRDRLRAATCLSWQRVLPERTGHVYFTDRHSYADRLYDTVLALHAQAPLDVIDVPDVGGEALTLLRAKRLLAQFPRTCVAVSLQPGSTVRHGAAAHQPASFTAELTAHAERYARSHASIVLAAGTADAQAAAVDDGRLRRYLPGLPDLPELEPDLHGARRDAALTIVWLGPIYASAGLATLLRGFALAHEQEPALRLVLRGADTPTDPVGRSYWQHLRKQMTEPLRQSVSFQGPPRAGQLGTLPPAGAQCVLAAGLSGSPLDALLAMAAGYLVITPAGSIGADVIKDGETGWLIPDGDPVALADTWLASLGRFETALRRASTAAEVVRSRFSPRRVGERLSELYASAPAPRPGAAPARRGEPVSVVIPVYNQGKYLPAALDSIRRSGLESLNIIVVDDGSTVASPLLLTGSRGPARPRQRGLKCRTGLGARDDDTRLGLQVDGHLQAQLAQLPAAVGRLSQLAVERIAQLSCHTGQGPAELAHPARKLVDQLTGTQIPGDAGIRDNLDKNLGLIRHVDPPQIGNTNAGLRVRVAMPSRKTPAAMGSSGEAVSRIGELPGGVGASGSLRARSRGTPPVRHHRRRRSCALSTGWSRDRIRRTVGLMPEPGEEPRPRSSPGAMLSNWMTSDAPFAAKLRMAASNTFIKLRKRQACCGNHGQPGC